MKDDAEVLDRVIGEQALHLVDASRVEHAEHGGDAAQRQDDQNLTTTRFANPDRTRRG